MTVSDRRGTLTAICDSGHENPTDRLFCGECGLALMPDIVTCPFGHVSSAGQRFCGDCGAPVAPPVGAPNNGTTGRWATDLTGRHQYRFWDGHTWTAYVSDKGKFGINRYSGAVGRPDSWVAVAVALATVCLLLGAAVDVWVQLSRVSSGGESTSEAATTTSTAAEPSPPPAPGAPPPAALPNGPAVIASPCRPGGGNGTTADGSVAYCELLATTDKHLWSLYQGDIPFPDVNDGTDPAVGVCMVQTERTMPDCLDYLKRAGGPEG
ncbi:zinc ribbon domain-containing protein [Mycolicibacterium brisbanense]|uniref:zinc ribbon domain-containing protein n=1 Tax=Mycolicibacterium brisbanense TaxID=146020 RepID=UPI000A8A68E0|nr:zinc ribbon domain-containing protein [Mycolicibacterium brisbanense]MCV7160677.1 zinc ribbon domain-containing protein [Mycolicibacterium brisbanense]